MIMIMIMMRLSVLCTRTCNVLCIEGGVVGLLSCQVRLVPLINLPRKQRLVLAHLKSAPSPGQAYCSLYLTPWIGARGSAVSVQFR